MFSMQQFLSITRCEMITNISFSRSEQNSITCSHQFSLKLLDGDNLNVQNDSNSERILSAENAAAVDYAVNLGLMIIP